MSSPALSKTRTALGVVMATATLATTGLAGSLALSRNQAAGDGDAANNPAEGATAPTSTRRAHQKPTAAPAGFAPASKPTSTTRPSHTRTSGS